MKRSSITLGTLALLTAICVFPVQGRAASFSLFQGSKKVEAEENKEYYLKDSDGYWFILAKKFAGDDARSRANKLAFELRKKYKLPAFVYKYDPDQNDLEEMAEKTGYMKRFRYLTPKTTEIAVLVGSFPTIDDLELQKVLLTVKRSKPECLNNDPESKQIVAEFEKISKKEKEFRDFGPLGGAIVVRNPLISKDFYCQKGVVDPFVEKINSDSKYSLLNNPKMYTLRVATFSGGTAFECNGKKKGEIKSTLREAGVKAAALCEALRKRGIEAWEFHDRDSSFVSVGSFDNYGTVRPDGRTEMNPEINKLIEMFQGEIISNANGAGSYRAFTISVEINDPNSTAFGGIGKKVKLDLPFDLQPVIIMVPQKPENAKRTLQAQRRLKTELEQYEMKRIEENEDFDRDYAKYAIKGTKPLPIDSPQVTQNEAFMSEFSRYRSEMSQNSLLDSNFSLNDFRQGNNPVAANGASQNGVNPQVALNRQNGNAAGFNNNVPNYSNVPNNGNVMNNANLQNPNSFAQNPNGNFQNGYPQNANPDLNRYATGNQPSSGYANQNGVAQPRPANVAPNYPTNPTNADRRPVQTANKTAAPVY